MGNDSVIYVRLPETQAAYPDAFKREDSGKFFTGRQSATVLMTAVNQHHLHSCSHGLFLTLWGTCPMGMVFPVFIGEHDVYFKTAYSVAESDNGLWALQQR